MAEHGTYTRYFREKCGCEKCRAYQRNRVRRNRKDRLDNKRLNHGSRSAYDAGCRCEQCRDRRAKISVLEGTTYPSGSGTQRHNHITRDIKPYGECPACDDYHAGVGR